MKHHKAAKVDSIIEPSDFEKKLPLAIQKHVFSFFNQKELRLTTQVNKHFNQLGLEEMERMKKVYKENVFYSVGNPIRITNPKPSFLEMNFGMNYRKIIPSREIHDSFSGLNIQKIKLFNTEYEALEYSRSLRTGDPLLEGTEVYQPGVFKVIYFGQVDNTMFINENLVINRGRSSDATEWNERTTNIKYFATDRSHVIPVEGALKIHLSDIGKFKVYGSIDYADLDFLEEKKSASSLQKGCVIS
ncbi:Uncharacterised protein [Legionella busanensis]|uniref:F-box domain-containing protein n=1 Tax=Legionella busanensis TaxID=190655 RepID=A0A378KDC9_9GAMM|nr:hypothetical protein [Legionella busanensis]STX81521.1 Uncharacterised protein [Legionella busanensis]